MAEGEIHKKLKVIAMKQGKELCTDLVAREVKYKNMKSIADVVSINIKRKEVRIFEAKATKADYLRDKKLINIDEIYYKHSNYFYIICPKNIIMPEDICKEYGLIWVDLDTLEIEIKQKPKKYTGRLKTMFNTSLKNVLKAVTNDLLFHYVYPENGIETEYKKRRKRSTKKTK